MQAIERRFGALTPYIVCFTAALFFAYELMQMHMLSAIAPMVMLDLKLNATNFGLLGSTYLLADVIFLIPAGIILDRFSIRKVIIVAMILCIIGTFGFALSTTFLGACFFHFISGIGNAFCFLSCMMLVSRWFSPSKQSFIIGLVITIGMFGGFMAQSPFSALASALSWRNALFVDGLIGIFLFLLIGLFVYDKDHVSSNEKFDEKFFTNLKNCFSSKQNIACGLFISLMNMPLMIIGAVYGSLFLTQIHHVSLLEGSFIISMICVGTIVGSPIFGYLGDISSKRKLMAYSSFGSIVLFMTILFLPLSSFSMLSMLFFTLGLFTSSQVLGYPLITESCAKESTGTSISIAGVLVMGLPMFLVPLTGTIMDMFSKIHPETGIRVFPQMSFQSAFLIFPLGFFIALCAVYAIKEKLSTKALVS